MNIFSALLYQELVTFQWDDDDDCFVQGEHT